MKNKKCNFEENISVLKIIMITLTGSVEDFIAEESEDRVNYSLKGSLNLSIVLSYISQLKLIYLW